MSSLNFPKYWGSLEEFEPGSFDQENKGKEFLVPPEGQPITEMERRSFLKLMGAGMLLATAGCYRRPVEKVIPYVNRPEEILPGVADEYTSTCGECAAGCGILVKTREGRPIKLEGNPEHPLNRGGLCPRGQASLLNLYDPDRLKAPVVVAAKGHFEDLAHPTWEEIDRSIQAELSKLKSTGGKVYFLTGASNSSTTTQLIQEFLAHYPQGRFVSFDAVVPEEVGLGQRASYGQKLTPRYRFDKAQLIVSFGADFLGTWLSPVEFTKDFASSRRVENGSMARFIAFESALSVTGSNADDYFALKAGHELGVALALANEMITQNKNARYAGDVQVLQTLAPYTIEKIALQSGVPATDLKRVARELWAAKGKGLVLGGAGKAKNGVALQVVVNFLNSLLENDGSTVDYAVPSYQAQSSYADLLTLVNEMNQGQVAALFIYQSNPVYTLPSELKFAEALKKIPLVISFADRLDETSPYVSYVCPDSHYLESWNDAHPQEGIYSIVQPVVAPLYQTRSFQDSLIQWAGLPYKSWYEYLKNNWQKKIASQGSSEKNWEQALQKGIFETGKRRDSVSPPRSASISDLQNMNALPSDQGADHLADDLVLSLYPSQALLDGRSANNGWLQELPDPVSRITWDNYLSLSPRGALKRGLQEGDVVSIQVGGIHVLLPVHLEPRLHEKSAMVAVGYGRSKSGRVGDQVGVNVFPLQQIQGQWLQWGGIPFTLRKTGKLWKLASAQGYTNTEGRPVIEETSYQAYLKYAEGTSEAKERPESLPSMWPEWEYKGYRWGMAIDTNACTGCNACVIGCQSENNIPVVGKEQVLNGRIMHWIRIDRYYSIRSKKLQEELTTNRKALDLSAEKQKIEALGPHEIDFSYQPMLCQHCENAPCETVCPTLATLHSDEGLNMQIYNRCVGTRYCANNCPYKVRRFNFFDYTKNLVAPLHWVLNPDITTRTRGVMEKCTFCMQRIRDAKDHAKDKKRPVKDGEVKTACQQSCPADAIVFGNVNDSKSQVSGLRQLGRGYRVLEELNVKPQITYLKKVRNREENNRT